MPTTIASETGDPQKIYLGTPPGPKCAGTVFRGLHDKAHAGSAIGIWWVEWAATSIPDMSDPMAVLELVYQTNPAMGYRIKEDVMLDVIHAVTNPDGFAREFLGWWVDLNENVNAAITVAEWSACAIAKPTREGDVTYAVRFSPDGKRVAFASCHYKQGCVPFVYVVDTRSMAHGLGWLVTTLTQNWEKAKLIVIDGQANAQTLYNRLVEAGVKRKALRLAKSTDATSAYSGFLNAVREGHVTHFGQPALDKSATGSEKRLIGKSGGWGFESTETADATLVEACCWAHWGATTSKRKPGRKVLVR